MGKLYIDEKGPQEHFKVSEPFDDDEKLAYGTDKMNSYVACGVYIPDSNEKMVNDEFLVIEQEYLQNTQNPKMELKAERFFKKKFKYGVYSMRDKDVIFYIRLLQILTENECSVLSYSISKMSVLFNVKLLEWIYTLDEKKFGINILSLKYCITKYLNNEASQSVIESLVDIDADAIILLNEIQRDMKRITIEQNNNQRMIRQVATYKQIIDVIVKYKHFANYDIIDDVAFDWFQVANSIDLWITEREFYFGELSKDVDVFLDNGIPKDIFEILEFKTVNDNCNSREIIGIRLADLIVGYLGNFIKNLNTDNRHNKEKKDEVKYLNCKWFEIDEKRFDLLKLTNEFYLNGGQYSYLFDTYFDQELLFESYIKYINSYKSYESYRKLSSIEHRNKFHINALNRMLERSNEQVKIYSIIGGRIRENVEDGMFKKP